MGTTLEAIGYTVAAGIFTTTLSHLLFGYAVYRRNPIIAPRIHGRPPNVLYNPSAQPGDVQYRGGPMLGYIRWVLGLNYDTLLSGVPGTGTRDGGLKGKLLNVGLDGIVLLRFHALCLRVAALATVLCLCVVLPLNVTAKCVELHDGLVVLSSTNCRNPEPNKNYTLTNYERTTLANIPPIIHPDQVVSSTNATTYAVEFNLRLFENAIWGGPPWGSILGRLYFTVICAWIVTAYACFLLKVEWKDMVALRRAYYLENDIWAQRKRELEETIVVPGGKGNDCPGRVGGGGEDADDYVAQHESVGASEGANVPLRVTVPEQSSTGMDGSGGTRHPSSLRNRCSSNVSDRSLNNTTQECYAENEEGHEQHVMGMNEHEERPHTSTIEQQRQHQKRVASGMASGSCSPPKERRDPWILNPDLRDTPPHVELYSVLVGHLPQIPSEVNATRRKVFKPPPPEREMDHVAEGGRDRTSLMAGPEEDDQESMMAVNWQLELVKAFFHQCIPTQPGYTSSVVAATIIPDGWSIALAWRRWIRLCKSIRRLRYIRAQVALIESELGGEGSSLPVVREKESDGDYEAIYKVAMQMESQYAGCHDPFYTANATREEMYLEHPEQMAVYAREYALDSAYCFPYCLLDTSLPICKSGKGDLSRQLEEWKQLEEEGVERIAAAKNELSKIQKSAVQKLGPIPVLPQNFRRSTINLGLRSLRSEDDMLEDGGVPEIPARLRQSRQEDPLKGESSMDPCAPAPEKRMSIPCIHSPSILATVNSEGKFMGVTGGRKKRPPSKFGHYSYTERSLRASNLSRAGSADTADHIKRSTSSDDWYPSRDSGVGCQPRLRPPTNQRVTTKGTVPLEVDEEFQSMELEQSHLRRKSVQWRRAEKLRKENGSVLEVDVYGSNLEELSDGAWRLSSRFELKRIVSLLRDNFRVLSRRMVRYIRMVRPSDMQRKKRDGESACSSIHSSGVFPLVEARSKSSFAVVTFTSRQAAVAARHCLADGRGAHRWTVHDNLPMAPLPDAATCDFCLFRNHFCRPVSPTMGMRERRIRKSCSRFFLFVVYVFWIAPITFVAQLVKPEVLDSFIGNIKVSEALSGLIPGLMQTLFLVICPVLFKGIANSGSIAHSYSGAESAALQHYWWFMVVSAFSGQSIATMVYNGYLGGDLQLDVKTALLEIASTIPTQISAVWINWIIVRSLITLQLVYLLQMISFILGWFGCGCCFRLTMGGGPGKHPPYRLYIDSGVVFMCTVALSYASPLVAPFALIYFLISNPLLRRNFIYVYRMKFDSGGSRWPFLFNVCMSSIVLGQCLLALMMLLKRAIGPALFAFAPVFPTVVFWKQCRRRFLAGYLDAALLQTSRLDEWCDEQDDDGPSTEEEREEFRRFLVDAHKAAYVPVCLAGSAARDLTSEPASVVPLSCDVEDAAVEALIRDRFDSRPRDFT